MSPNTERPAVQVGGIEFVVARKGGFLQRLHAGAVVVVPAAACLVAIGQVAQGLVGLWEIATALILYVMTFSGITVGYHRLLAHRAFRTGPIVRATLLALGSMAAQGPPIYWVGNHRRHHRFSDKAGDPHSPLWIGDERPRSALAGFLHAHLGWIFDPRATNTIAYCKDLFQDRVVVWVNRRYHLWLVLGLAIPAGIGVLAERSLFGAWQGLVWGAGVRVLFSYHFASSVNSVTHMFGSRPYATRENSTNNAWFSVPTLGEAWHNNHHACASSAFFGFRWWEVDIGGLVIRMLVLLGLASDVVRPDPRTLEQLRVLKGNR